MSNFDVTEMFKKATPNLQLIYQQVLDNKITIEHGCAVISQIMKNTYDETTIKNFKVKK
ncbi:hypothetical protein RWF45_001065 [Salmonella enterica]|nr:hypothetical protein [Salmonella enterica]EJU7779410.1 hypothetical protein [Salmonella enterica subsp. arizonae serovar 56:z36:-]EIB1174534.1 hypothetical protein [Salmonella enterica]EJC5331080.1 hypothetical protein [Salmonella enterica]EKA4599754.1 hypothetical protein [Salmonella enterica]